MGIIWTVLIFIKMTAGPVGTAVASARGAVASGTTERTVLRTVRCTLAAINTFFIMIALQRHLTLMGKSSVKFDLFANSRLILADGLGDGRFGGAVCNAGKNDTPFL